MINVEMVESGPLLDIRPHLLILRAALETEDTLDTLFSWNRDGKIIHIPRGMIRNLIGAYDDNTKLLETGRITMVPPDAYMIRWDETYNMTIEKFLRLSM